jgi:hypothetical protein
MHPPRFFLAELAFRFAGRYLVIYLRYLCMCGLCVDVVSSSDYIGVVAATCWWLARLVGAARPGCIYLGTERCSYRTFEHLPLNP